MDGANKFLARERWDFPERSPIGRAVDATGIAGWSIAIVVLIVRAGLLSDRATALTTYGHAAHHWLGREALYIGYLDFVYSPLAAAFFASFVGLPQTLRSATWLIINAGVFLSGVVAIVWTDFYPKLGRKHIGIVLLILLPLTLGNLDVMQANPFDAGLLMLAMAAAWKEKWGLAALCVALATYFKIYPVVVGILIFLVAPRPFGWRLLLALLILGLLPFSFQHAGYVRDQYHAWFATRMADNRLNLQIMIAPMDLWMLLVRLGGLPIAPWLYRTIQVLSGAAIALYCILGTRREWERRRLLVGLFSLASIWMTLCGPATEGYTYLILAPAVVYAAIEAHVNRQPVWLRSIVFSSTALLLLTAAKNSLAPRLGLWTRPAQPLAAIIFLGYCLPWLLNDSLWLDSDSESRLLPVSGRRAGTQSSISAMKVASARAGV